MRHINISEKIIIGLWVSFSILLVAIFNQIFTYSPNFFANDLLSQLTPSWLSVGAHFDGILYLIIATQGYHSMGSIQAFFPLYPELIRLVSFFIRNPLVSGLLISWTAGISSFIILRKIIPDRTQYVRTLGLLVAFPTAFYFLSVYTESLFLLLALLTVLLVRKNKWKWAGVIGFLAGLTRLQGVFVSLLLLVEANQHKVIQKHLGVIVAPILGLIVYMFFLGFEFHNPLLFMTVQNSFGAQRSSGILIPILTPLFRYLKILVTVPVWSHAFYISVQELVLTVGGFYLAWRLWLRKEYGYGLYAFSSLLLPTLTGTLSSMPRYILVIFPLFIELSRMRTKWYTVILIGFMIVQVINLALFTQGLWVA